MTWHGSKTQTHTHISWPKALRITHAVLLLLLFWGVIMGNNLRISGNAAPAEVIFFSQIFMAIHYPVAHCQSVVVLGVSLENCSPVLSRFFLLFSLHSFSWHCTKKLIMSVVQTVSNQHSHHNHNRLPKAWTVWDKQKRWKMRREGEKREGKLPHTQPGAKCVETDRKVCGRFNST